ncbi:MAG: DUF3786 domain-containing protein [Desulfosalsimonadaceae bacterium]
MPLSVIDLYRDVLPQTNCGDCGYPTCMAFAGMVVSEKLALENCPHLDAETLEKTNRELQAQYREGKWLKRDMAADALEWARKRCASMKIEDLPERIGGEIIDNSGQKALELPYFNDSVIIGRDGIVNRDGSPITRNEQVFLYIHMAQGGSKTPTGKWKSLKEFPNTVSKVVSMVAHVEKPLVEKFAGNIGELKKRAEKIGGIDKTGEYDTADLAVFFQVLPRIPVMLVFWDAQPEDGFGAEAKLLFDETIPLHLDIESIMFLSERLKELLLPA